MQKLQLLCPQVTIQRYIVKRGDQWIPVYLQILLLNISPLEKCFKNKTNKYKTNENLQMKIKSKWRKIEILIET